METEAIFELLMGKCLCTKEMKKDPLHACTLESNIAKTYSLLDSVTIEHLIAAEFCRISGNNKKMKIADIIINECGKFMPEYREEVIEKAIWDECSADIIKKLLANGMPLKKNHEYIGYILHFLKGPKNPEELLEVTKILLEKTREYPWDIYIFYNVRDCLRTGTRVEIAKLAQYYQTQYIVDSAIKKLTL